MNVVALVCARGGSKGIPGKNLRELGGRPLIEWSILQAWQVKAVTRVIVSTDSQKISSVARQAGADVPFIRPAELATDKTPEWLVWRHALEHLRSTDAHYDALLVVPPTAPLRAVEDLENCVAEYEKGDADVVIAVTDAHRNPYFNMVKLLPDETVSVVISGDDAVTRRQDAPEVFDVTTVAYVANPQFVMTHDRIFDGRVRRVHVPLERAIDIDTPLDLRIAECLFKTK